MTNYLNLSIVELNKKLKDKEIRPIDLVNEAFDRIDKNKELNAFITLNREDAIKEALKLEDMEVDNLLFGLPIAIKDNIVTCGLRTTCASLMLDNFIPIYDASVVLKLKSKHMIIIGKTNMDEFAMGSTSRSSYYGAPLNPWDRKRISGGSSGGSAVCVSSRMVPLALGSDTGGSVRQPASYCGVVGMKPTYGRISRYGLVAFASSLDQIGPFTTNVYDNALLLNALVGRDDKDLTSVDRPFEDFTSLIGEDIFGMKIGLPNYFMSDIVSSDIKNNVLKVVKLLEDNGASVSYIDIDYIENAVTLYEIIAKGEASSNLARFDGVRFGYKAEGVSSVDELYEKTRMEGFGEEVKRRIMIGSYILSGDNATIYYNKALQIRDDMRKSFKDKFKEFDLIIGPVTTTGAYLQTENLDNPLQSFLDDVLVIPVNLAGLPGMSVPIGFNDDNMPVGLHIIGDDFMEAKMYKLAFFIESKLNLDLMPKDV